jgi:hypothetical protein
MTNEQITQWAREAGFAMRGVPASYWNCLPRELEAFAEIVRNATLDEAAKVTESFSEECSFGLTHADVIRSLKS